MLALGAQQQSAPKAVPMDRVVYMSMETACSLAWHTPLLPAPLSGLAGARAAGVA